MYKKVFNVVSQIIGVSVESLNEESSRGTVEYWDSLKHMNIILALEEEFNISFSDEEITKINSIHDIINVFKKKGVLDGNI